MLNRFSIFFSILLFFVGNVMPIISKDNTLEKNSTSLTIDYLNSFSGNDYILGPGDSLKLIVSRFYPELTSMYRRDQGNRSTFCFDDES